MFDAARICVTSHNPARTESRQVVQIRKLNRRRLGQVSPLVKIAKNSRRGRGRVSLGVQDSELTCLVEVYFEIC